MSRNAPLNDLELLSLLREGDTNAFEEIYKRYATSLFRYARKSISSKEDCEEIIQDIFLSLWQRHHELAHITVLNAYLFQMVKYKVIRYLQHSVVKKKYADHYRLFEAVYDSTEESDREHTIQELINKGLAKLPERCQQAVKLRLTENLSNGDIARRMNIKKSTVENYIVVAVSQLRTVHRSLLEPN
jgi:RNA polymerase sigma-70 factor (family 1)